MLYCVLLNKIFKFLVTNAIDCTGTINGVDPSNIITLTGSQFITGTTTFKQLEVTESLEVHIRMFALILIDFIKKNIYPCNRIGESNWKNSRTTFK